MAHAPFGKQVVHAPFGEQVTHAPFGEQVLYTSSFFLGGGGELHTDPEQASGWTLTTTQANGCLRTFNVVTKSSLVNQNLLWGHL
jgi:hypothetical protein